MFELLSDREHNSLLTRLSGTYGLEDVIVRDREVLRFVERAGACHGLMDFSQITAVDVPMEVIVRRAQAPPLLSVEQQVMVASGEPGYGLCRVIAAHQYFGHGIEARIVRSLGEAASLLGVEEFAFRPIARPAALAQESDVIRFVVRVDQASRRDDERLDELARRARRKRFDTAYDGIRHSSVRGGALPVAITVGDLLNLELSTRIDDSDLRMDCPGCRTVDTLGRCQVELGRSTTYSCGVCSELLAVVTPLRRIEAARGYPLGGFDVRLAADVSCLEVVLPRTGVSLSPLHKPPGARARRPAVSR